MFIQLVTIPVTVSAGGAATVYSDGPVVGLVRQLRYVPDGSTPLDTGADVTITGETTGVAIATLTDIGTSAFTKGIRQASHDATGVAALYAAAGQPVDVEVALAQERIKLVVAQGGNAKSGTFYLWVG